MIPWSSTPTHSLSFYANSVHLIFHSFSFFVLFVNCLSRRSTFNSTLDSIICRLEHFELTKNSICLCLVRSTPKKTILSLFHVDFFGKIGNVIKFLTRHKTKAKSTKSHCNLADPQERIGNVYTNGGHVRHVLGSNGHNPFRPLRWTVPKDDGQGGGAGCGVQIRTNKCIYCT